MLERITVQEQGRVYDAVITYELDHEEGTRMLMSHLLWSIFVFMIALLI
jgi:hypothetical protein